MDFQINQGLKAFIIGTDVCNLSCTYCANDKTRRPEEYNKEKIIDSLQKCLVPFDKPNHQHWISLSGGEPLMDLDLIEDIKKVFENKPLALTIFTNGFLLTKSIHEKIIKNVDYVSYCFGVDSTEVKNLIKLWENKEVRKICEEGNGSFIHVIDSENCLSAVKEELPIIIENNLKIIFVFNYKNPYRSSEIVNIAPKLSDILQDSGYVPRITGLHDSNCSQISIHRDGRIVSNCYSDFDTILINKFNKYKKFICSKCKNKLYCASCYTNAVDRYGLGNYCKWIDAVCVNIKEGDNI
jgi:MoaA/NifB/PqqE/SkfB family radical SAM enzyme